MINLKIYIGLFILSILLGILLQSYVPATNFSSYLIGYFTAIIVDLLILLINYNLEFLKVTTFFILGLLLGFIPVLFTQIPTYVISFLPLIIGVLSFTLILYTFLAEE